MADILFALLFALIKAVGLVFVIILPMVSYTVYAERRVSAMIQDRLGPNRVGHIRTSSTNCRCGEAVVKGRLHPAQR